MTGVSKSEQVALIIKQPRIIYFFPFPATFASKFEFTVLVVSVCNVPVYTVTLTSRKNKFVQEAGTVER